MLQKLLSALFSFLWEWNEHLQQDLREQEKISACTTHQTVAQLGWMDSVCSPWTPSLWESLLSWPGWLPRCSVWPSASQLSPTQPNPTRFSSFSPFSFSCADIFILLLKLLRAHYLRGRNAALIVWWLQSLGPFFSVCNQPTLASCSETHDSSSTWTMSPPFSARNTQSRL